LSYKNAVCLYADLFLNVIFYYCLFSLASMALEQNYNGRDKKKSIH
jgi:hypothetical protein